MGSSTEEIYTVLLYGETGVGKSTLINACDNYIKFPTLEEALDSDKICCRIPIKFLWQNDEYEDVTVEYGSHANEKLDEVGASATQNLNIHYYKYQNKVYRFVDTPGFNDTRGYEAELENVKNMMETATNYFSAVHALCILLKSGENRENLQFKYGIMQFLSLFHRNMCGNIIFLYTHSRGTDYKQNYTGRVVRKIIGEIENNVQGISIQYGPNNVFLLDNAGFNYLLAVKLGKDSAADYDTYSADWSKSASVCYQLLEYIKTLDCRSICDTLQLYDSKLKLENLYYDGLRVKEELNKLKMKVDECNSKIDISKGVIERFRNSLYDIVVTIREGPYHMVCYNSFCNKKEVYSVDGKACCPNCISWAKIFCFAFDHDVCKYCGCSVNNHRYLNKIGFREKEKRKNVQVQEMIIREENLLRQSYKSKNMFIDAINELEKNNTDMEKDIMPEVMFINDNAILPYHNECIDHIRMEMDRSSGEKKERLARLLQRYESVYNLVLHFRNENYQNEMLPRVPLMCTVL